MSADQYIKRLTLLIPIKNAVESATSKYLTPDTDGVLGYGFDGTGYQALQMDEYGKLKVSLVDTTIDLGASGIALETGGNLAALNSKVTACNTGAIAGTVTANAGTNLNTSALALEAGGNLEQVAINTSSDGGFARGPDGRVRGGQATKLFDGKILNADRALLWNTAGTGTGAFSNNMYEMSVTSAQWKIRQSALFIPYLSGNPTKIEMTCEKFQLQANVVKRIGYFSSNAVSPFDTTYDGFYVENTGTSYVLYVKNAGTTVLSLDWTLWDGYSDISSYNFEKFTVFAFDFLWLGGAVLRIWLKRDTEFVLCHVFTHAGNNSGTMTKSPNHPVRYEIRSSTGSGAFTPICSMVETEGGLGEFGYAAYADSGRTALVSCATAGTTYPIAAVRKAVAGRDVGINIHEINMGVGSNSDQGVWTLQRNPTLSAPLTYAALANTFAVERAGGDGIITVSADGRILGGGFVIQGAVTPTGMVEKDFASWLTGGLDNTMDQFVLCFTPLTSNCTIYGGISLLEY